MHFRPRQRATEDDLAEALLRHQRAEQSVIDSNDLPLYLGLLSSSKPLQVLSLSTACQSPCSQFTCSQVAATALEPPTEHSNSYITRDAFSPPPLLMIINTDSTTLNARKVGVIHAKSYAEVHNALSAKMSKRRRKYRRHSQDPSPTPRRARFYSPSVEMGGKSRGYAMGWRVEGYSTGQKYVRVNMNKAVMASI